MRKVDVGRAAELLPVGPRRAPAVYPGMDLTDTQRVGLDIEECFASGPAGAPNVRVLVYRPKAVAQSLPLVIRIHGGSFIGLRADSFPATDARIAFFGSVVVSVDYRLAPEHRSPAAAEDCYAALCWAVKKLDVDPKRVIVAGSSSGGALAAAVTLMARDRGGPRISHQLLHVPVLDDRLDTPSMRQYVTSPGFNATAARGMWLHYLGENADRSHTSPLAAPARAEDLSGLPPAFIQVNGLDPLRDEGIAYASRLLAAGVQVELYCAPGLPHGAVPADSGLAAWAETIFDAATERALGAQ